MGQCVTTIDANDIPEKENQAHQDEKGKGHDVRSTEARSSEKSPDNCDPEVVAYLHAVPLLSQLSANEQRVLGSNLRERRFNDGEKIIVEGHDGDDFFLIKEGVCIVSKMNAETRKPDELVRLKKGDYFGEGALRNNGKRAATIAAAGPVVCLTLSRSQFQSLFGASKLKVTFGKRVAVSAEAYNPEHDHDDQEASGARERRKNATQEAMLLGVVQKNMLFQGLGPQQQHDMVQAFWRRQVPPDHSIIKQGDLGDNFYVVEKGRFDIFVRANKQTKPAKVAERGPGDCFGDLALMYNAPRAATVTAREESEVWALDRWTFRKLLTTGHRDKIRVYEDFLAQVQSFAALLSEERAKVAEALELVTFPEGHDIIREGDTGDTFFILMKGEVRCTKLQADNTRKEVKRYYRGDYFGERALIKNEARAATCTTVSPTECLYLNRRGFERLLGPLEDIFAERVAGYTRTGDGPSSNKHSDDFEQRESGGGQRHTGGGPGAGAKERENAPLAITFKPSDLTVIGTLGKGSFGHVQLVKDKESHTYALKTVSKAQIVKLGQQEHIMSEKRVMAMLDHPFLVRLWGTAKDNNCLYFLLEPSLGGELFSVLRAKTFFDEATARFFSASVVLAFEYMHSKNIIYRDLKPENLLLDEKGYLKITDFGFAKVVKERTWTLCGTPDYLAPEVVSGQGHNKGVDWWTLGILIYEMLASYPPFYDEDPMKTYAKIMHGQLAFPMHFSKAAQELIRKLLSNKPTKRLGVIKGGAKLLKENLWFKGFDWDLFLSKQMSAPIVPTVKSPDDLSNFEDYPDEEDLIEPYQGDPNQPDWDLDF